MRSKSGNETIARRDSKGNLKILYLLKKQAKIDRGFTMFEVVAKDIKDRIGSEFRGNVKEVLN